MLPREEPEAGTLVQQAFEAEGMVVRVGVMAKEVSRIDNSVSVTLSDGTELRAERLLVATGRRTDVAALGLDTVGVDLAGPFVSTDAHMRVTSGVWAVGDITGEGLFTHVGVYQAGVARADILGEPGPPADYSAVPRVSFTDPEVGAVGLTEAEARAEGLNVETASVDVPATARGWLHAGGNEGVIKLVADADKGVLVGATSVGPHGGEVLAMLTLFPKDPYARARTVSTGLPPVTVTRARPNPIAMARIPSDSITSRAEPLARAAGRYRDPFLTLPPMSSRSLSVARHSRPRHTHRRYGLCI